MDKHKLAHEYAETQCPIYPGDHVDKYKKHAEVRDAFLAGYEMAIEDFKQDKGIDDKVEFGEWQICPKCSGQGIVSKPSHVAGDVNTWTANATSFCCNVCNGEKILARPISGRIITFDKAALPNEKLLEKLKDYFSKEPLKFVPDPEPWSANFERAFKNKLQEEFEYYFGLTHYDWMYAATKDEKYLKEQEEYRKKHGR